MLERGCDFCCDWIVDFFKACWVRDQEGFVLVIFKQEFLVKDFFVFDSGDDKKIWFEQFVCHFARVTRGTFGIKPCLEFFQQAVVAAVDEHFNRAVFVFEGSSIVIFGGWLHCQMVGVINAKCKSGIAIMQHRALRRHARDEE
jgi:hypothetical protein